MNLWRNPVLFGFAGLAVLYLLVLSPQAGSGPAVLWGWWGYEKFVKKAKPKQE
jgi:hypothetical protein